MQRDSQVNGWGYKSKLGIAFPRDRVPPVWVCFGFLAYGEMSVLHLCNPQSASDMRTSQDRGSPNDGKRVTTWLTVPHPCPHTLKPECKIKLMMICKKTGLQHCIKPNRSQTTDKNKNQNRPAFLESQDSFLFTLGF